MAANSVEKWLEEKRRQQSRSAGVDLGLAPSPMDRYGFNGKSKSVDARGGMLPSGAAMATGYGDDGRMQRMMPTQIRQTPGGNRYAVDEGEVVVVDAATVGRYGGAQALDKFVRQNAPAKPFRSPSMPYAGEGNVGQPSGGQGRVAEQVQQQGIRQYATGGVPDWIRNQAGAARASTTELSTGAIPAVNAGAVTAATGMKLPTIGEVAPVRTAIMPGATRHLLSEDRQGTVFDNMSMGNFVAGGARTPPTTSDAKPVDEVRPDEIPADEVRPDEIPADEAPPGEIPPARVVPDAKVPDGSPVYKPNEIDQAILNYYSQRTGATQESERASEAQALQQQGVSPETMRGVQAASDISRRQGAAEQTAQFGVQAMQQAEERRATEQEHATKLAQIAEDKKRYGDQEYTRMATDVKNGMTYDQLKAKYPNQNIDEQDYSRLRNTLMAPELAASRANAAQRVSAYASQQATANPEYVSGGAWKTDEQMTQRLSEQWTADGMVGEFDPNNIAHAAWAESQLVTATMSPEEIALNGVRATRWYQGLSDDDKKEVDDLLDFAMIASVTGGYTVGQNADGSHYLMDKDGSVVAGTKADGTGGAGGSSVTADEANNLVSYLTENGVDTTTLRARQYLMEHPGASSPTPEEWNAWDASTANISNISKYLNGDATAALSAVDTNHLNAIIVAQTAVANGTATEAQKVLAASIPQQIRTWNFGTTISGKGQAKKFYAGGRMGNLHRQVKVNLAMYDAPSSGEAAVLKDDVKAWVNANAGNIVMIDGHPYRISATQPLGTTTTDVSVVDGDDTYTQTFTFECINLIDVVTEATLQYTAGATGSLWD